MEIQEKKIIEYYGHVRSEILPLLPLRLERIFEVGCGAGDTLTFLKSTDRCEWAGGVEIFHDAVEQARSKNIDLVLEGNISELPIPVEEGSLDAILCLDVLEHLVDPWSVLQQLRNYLKLGGLLICSIPNVRNFRVVLPLVMHGRWTYSKEGILDQTHLRFFTKSSAITLVESSGFQVDMVSATGLEKWNKAYVANLLTLGLCRPYLEFQYLIRGIKK